MESFAIDNKPKSVAFSKKYIEYYIKGIHSPFRLNFSLAKGKKKAMRDSFGPALTHHNPSNPTGLLRKGHSLISESI